MNKYVVAYYSDFEGEILQEVVEAETKLDAMKSYLELDDSFDTIESVENMLSNSDSTISILQINNLPRSGRSGGENIVENRIH